MLAAPMARQQKKKLAAVTTGSAGTIRHSLRDGFTAYIALSLGTGLSCSHRPQRSSRQRAWPQRRETRTTRLCRPPQRRSSARKYARVAKASTAVPPHVSWRSRCAPLHRGGIRGEYTRFC